MAVEKTTTPLWLDIKKEYIDANFEKVLGYLNSMSGTGSKDQFYEDTLRLLDERAHDVLCELAAEPMHMDFGELDTRKITFQARLLGAYLLVKTTQEDGYNEFNFAFLRCLSRLASTGNLEDLFTLALSCLTSEGARLSGLSWDSVRNFNPQLLAYKITGANSSPSDKKKERALELSGVLKTSGNDIQILPASLQDIRYSMKSFSPSLKVAGDMVQVLVKAEDRLKQSDSSDYALIDKFVHDVKASQSMVRPTVVTLKRYGKGDRVDVRVADISGTGITLETISPDYEKITAPLKEEALFFYTMRDLIKDLRVGDYLPAKLASDTKPEFSIYDTVREFITGGYAQVGDEIPAVARKVSGSKVTWWTADGYPAYTAAGTEDVNEGDFGYISITKISDNGYINADYLEPTDEKVDIDDSKDVLISNFIYGEDFKAPAPKAAAQGLMKETADLLSRFLFSYQKTIPQMVERYRTLAVCRILATLTGDGDSLDYLTFMCDYLRDLAFFAQGRYDAIKSLQPSVAFADKESVESKVRTIDVLMHYGKNDENDIISDIIGTSSDERLVRIAKLVQSCNRISDVVSGPMLNSIKREITKSLSVDSENDSDLDEDNGIYLGMEDRLHEFKTSFVYPPDNGMRPNLGIQSQNIYKGLCAFLNSEAGGTLYLGVSDLGYVVGIDNDLEYLHKNHDGYIRLIQDEAKKYFDISVIAHWDFKVLYDGKVVAITVRPYELGIVELNGKAYVRLTGESVEMSESYRKQLLSRRVFADKDKASILNSLQIAVRERRQVILHKYSSSNSGNIRDRKVEPFSISQDGGTVWCWDLEAEANKVFSLSRVEYVEILEQAWAYPTRHQQGRSDAFHTSGSKPIKVNLELDLMAKNLLCEEYPDAKKDISKTKDDNVWLLNTEVYKIEALGRFYLGLAEHIRIISAPELATYAREYVKKNIQ